MIFDKIAILKNNNLARSSLIVFIGSFIGGIGSYIYNMLMGRMLGPADYGILASLISLFYIISVPCGTLSLVISRFIAKLRAHNQLREARYFINKINKLFFLVGAAVFVLFIFISPLIANFLRLPSVSPVIILGSVFAISFVGSANVAGLQGLQRFFQISVNSILGAFLKLVFGVFFVWLGWGVGGALGALALGGVIGILYAYFSLGLPKKSSATKIDAASMISYAKPVFWATFCIAALYNIDVILVKHFMDPETAGYYSILSLLGKIIFFITGSVAIVLFPAVVDRQSRNEKHSHILKYSIFLVLAGSLAITAVYFLFPHFIINLLFGSQYLSIASFLGYFGIVITFFSLINLLVTYNLSLNKTKCVPILIAGLGLEIALICFFHQDIWQIVCDMLAVMTLTFFALLAIERRK